MFAPSFAGSGAGGSGSGITQASSQVHTEASAALEASLQEILGYVNMAPNKTNAHNLMESEDAHKIYINKFVIAPIKVNVTFLVSSQVDSPYLTLNYPTIPYPTSP